MKHARAKGILFKIGRWVIGIALVLIFLLIGFIVALRFPAVQNLLTQKAISFLKNKIATEVRLESIYVSFPKTIVLQGFYMEDQSGDTLLYAGELNVDTDLWALLHNKIELNTIELINSKARIARSAKDNTFNFNYIIEAFAGDTTAQPIETDTRSAWQFSIEDVELLNTTFKYQDEYTGNDVFAHVGELNLSMARFDIEKSLYTIESIVLSETQASVIQRRPENQRLIKQEDTTSTNSLPNIGFSKINLGAVEFTYENTETKQFFHAAFGEFESEADHIDLSKRKIEIDHFDLKNSIISYRQDKKTNQQESVKQSKAVPFTGINIPWDVKVDEINLSANTLKYDDFNFVETKQSFNENHLLITSLQFSADDIEVKGSSLKGNIQKLSFQEKSGFAIQSFIAEVELTDQHIEIHELNFRSGNSKINLNGRADFPSLAQYQQATLNFKIEPSSIVLNDILFFSPSLLDSIPLKLPGSTNFLIETQLSGTMENLTINHFDLKTLNSTTVALQGSIKGLPEINRAVMKIELKRIRTTASDIKSILADSLLPESIQVPDWIELTGRYNGTLKSSNIKAILTSNLGNLEAEGKVVFDSVAQYDVVMKADQLDIGKLLKQSEMGILNMKGSVKGIGLTMDTLNTSFDVAVESFEYNQYTYKDFKLDGKLNNYLFSGSASLHDENLDFTFKGDLDYQQEIPLYKFTFALKNANFQKLNLSERPLKARGTLDINLATSDFKVINGNLAIRKVAIYNGESLYMVDSLLFASIDQEGESKMTISSDIISGEFNGTFNLFSIAGVMRQHLNQYFSLQDETLTSYTTPQQFKFDLTLKNTDLITEILIPDLDPFIPGKIKGEFNSVENKLKIEIDIAQIKYTTTVIDSLSVLVDSDAESLRYKFRLKNVKLDTLTIDATQFSGTVQHDSIFTSFQILNSKEEKKYVLGGVIRSQEGNFRLHFLQDQVMLNYSEWKVPADNYLEFSKQGLVAHNLSFASGEEKISLITTVKDSTVSLEFNELQLQSLTRIVRGVMPASGRLNGNLKFTTAARGMFNSKLRIDDLEVLEKPFGDLTMSLGHAGNRYTIDMQIKNDGSNVNTTGYYVSDDKISEFNLEVDLSPLNLQLIEPLSFGQLKNVKGTATGSLKVSGNFQQPSIRGKVTFNDASFGATYLNSTYHLTNETISFEEWGIVLNDFTILDQKRSEAVIDGSILTKAYKEFRFNLSITTRNFLILNTTEGQNSMFYGKVKINTKTRITGNANHPRVDMNVSFSDDTEFTYIVPQEQKSVMEQKGIVQFVDKDAYLDPFLANITLTDTVTSSFAGINLSANLELSDAVVLNIVIDPLTGDKLSVSGNSTLTFDMNASGNMDLSGRYEISSGTYQLSLYNLAKRKFEIEKGGTITWSGNPLNAEMNIRASYKVETTPLDLVANEINSTDQSQYSVYSQRLPFLVYLNIHGQLLAPQISFQLDMPVDKRGAFGGAIYAKINDINTRESDVNKQVFALLILRRFVSDNPLDSQGGSDISNTTRTSASRLLSDQLNRLSEKVKGVQLSFDIKSYEDYSTGTAQGDTQVQLGVSKSLFHDRLVVKVSGNVDVEGENSQQESVADYIGDIALEYKLTSDGRFRITGFRTSNYDMIDGELIETGAGLIYIKDYNTLRELFKANAK